MDVVLIRKTYSAGRHLISLWWINIIVFLIAASQTSCLGIYGLSLANIYSLPDHIISKCNWLKGTKCIDNLTAGKWVWSPEYVLCYCWPWLASWEIDCITEMSLVVSNYLYGLQLDKPRTFLLSSVVWKNSASFASNTFSSPACSVHWYFCIISVRTVVSSSQ